MAQTPQQRRANAAFARSEEKKMGRPQTIVQKKEKKEKAPISPFWVYMLIFVVCGGIIFEVVRMMVSGASGWF
ncbi:related to secretory pathway YSY6 [Lecanosticta acicola]|uniref:Stress-associated endoplasmic reticulum protein n=1 Tax=Lecanosticta acicola TaxID=111012 RepID=A0AAI8Z0E2_9PEZI|nr:related to secretory pathway YSY6 [Lecanosticta acicola]